VSYIQIRHNIEVAHRLSLLEGKCQNIHGHSMWVDLKLYGAVDETGILEGIDFGTAKHFFRDYLDTTYDHRLLLNENDPWAHPAIKTEWRNDGAGHGNFTVGEPTRLPGLSTFPGDPTTENLARWIAEWAVKTYGLPAQVKVAETSVNFASHFVGLEELEGHTPQ
jgi:6-pyruvoyltetrahydropterin/6-carboxytetrahydropterin synthase